jgi:hypothetical protein
MDFNMLPFFNCGGRRASLLQELFGKESQPRP